MKVSANEVQAIKDAISAGERFGYGNIINHLQSAWARKLVAEYGVSEVSAIKAAGGGYPVNMHIDIIETGEWDETGERYR